MSDVLCKVSVRQAPQLVMMLIDWLSFKRPTRADDTLPVRLRRLNRSKKEGWRTECLGGRSTRLMRVT